MLSRYVPHNIHSLFPYRAIPLDDFDQFLIDFEPLWADFRRCLRYDWQYWWNQMGQNCRWSGFQVRGFLTQLVKEINLYMGW